MVPHFGFSVEAKGDRASLTDQVHGDICLQWPPVGNADKPPADALYTREKNTKIYVFTADCLPVLLHDRHGAMIAAVHAGWRGARLGIVKKMLQVFRNDGLAAKAILGPSIGPCCFAVREDFLQAMTELRGDISSYTEKRGEQIFFDLPRFVIEQELSQIAHTDVDRSLWRCTYCSIPTLPSFRRDKQTNPRICAWIEMPG